VSTKATKRIGLKGSTAKVTANPKTLAKYIVKGTDPAFVEQFHITKVHAPQGRFRAQRARISAPLGEAASAAA